MKTTFLLLLVFLSTTALAKSDNFSDTVYYDLAMRKVKKHQDPFYYRIPAIKDGERYIASYFYVYENTPHRIITYLPQRVDYHWSIEDGVGIKDGPYVAFNISGDTIEKGLYKQNQKVGEWKYYTARILRATEYYYEKQHRVYQTNYYMSQKKASEGIITKYLKGHDTVFSRTGTWMFYFKDSIL